MMDLLEQKLRYDKEVQAWEFVRQFLLLLRNVFHQQCSNESRPKNSRDEWVLKYLTTHVDTEHTSH